MSVTVRSAMVAVAGALAVAAPAGAASAERCVDVQRATCLATYDDIPSAVAAAEATDTIVVAGEQQSTAAFTDAGKALYIRGLPGSVLRAPVELTGDGSALSGFRIDAPAGQSQVIADGGHVTLDDLVIQLGASDEGVLARCATVLARHVTMSGPDDAVAARATCATSSGAALDLRSSVLDGPTELTSGPNGTVTSHFSVLTGDPQLDDDLHPVVGSRVVDAGDPVPLAPDEPLADADALARVADGDGDGSLRRDAGAYELQPPAVALPADNVLTNPGAEDGLTGWSGSYETDGFGDPFFPSSFAGAKLGAGLAFFAGGTEPDPVVTQRIGIADSGRAIDTGGATIHLAGLLGGYGADRDAVVVSAMFRDPEGAAIDPALTIGPVTPADRANATNLLFRQASGGIPPRTRAIDVTVSGHRTDGVFTDAYADNLALELSVPGVPVDPQKPIVPGLKPFAGVTVLHPDATVTRKGQLRVALACANATVRSCDGTLELRARLPKAATATRIARFASFNVVAGRSRGVYMKLLAATRSAVRRRTSIRATLRAVATDGQKLQRIRTVPLTLRLPHRR